LELTLVSREAEGVALVDVTGILTRGYSSDALLDYVRKLLAAGNRKLILNLSGLAFFDSMGLSALMKSAILADEQGASLKLVQPRDMTAAARAATPLEMFSDEAQALASFRQPPLQ